ncbi:MAG: hypothetical protein AAF594_16220 [Bacteroidota bacterium]
MDLAVNDQAAAASADRPSLKERGRRVSFYLDNDQRRRFKALVAEAGYDDQTRFLVDRLGLDAPST